MEGDKLKTFLKGKALQVTLIILAILVAIFLLIWSGKKYIFPTLIDKYIQNRVEAIDQKYTPKMEQYEADIKALKRGFLKSQVRVNDLRNSINKLTKEAESIELPKDEKELRTRFSNLDYKPLD